MKIVLALATAILFATVPAPAIAQQANADQTVEADAQSPVQIRASQIVEMLNGELEAELTEVFTEAFLAAVPPAQLNTLSQQITGNFGRAIGVERLIENEGLSTQIEVRLERAIAKGMIAIDPSQGNRIIGLRFTTFEPIDDTAEKIEADLAALPGNVSVYFAPLDGEPVIEMAPDKQLAIGSTFKLYVLAALSRDIERGYRKWDDVVELDVQSFPSGQMQDWPQGAPVTLHTLASMMISISDNTATDQLIKVVGYDRLNAMLLESGHSQMALNEPFLTTRQLFLLKGGPKERLEAYRKGDDIARSDILADLESVAVPQDAINAAFTQGPVALDVEWFASGEDLAKLYAHMASFADQTTWDILAINTGVAPEAEAAWSYVGYKGGSEPGVLNLTWFLTEQSGKRYVLSLGWNNPEAVVDETTMELIAQRILLLPR